MTTSRTETVTVDGGSFDAHVVVPDAGSGPGLVVLQEIFGVNNYIRSVCERLARMGYVALAPDMFWRQEPGFVVESEEGEEGMQSAFAMVGGFDWSTVGADVGAAVDHLRRLPECTGDAGLIGFCFGGTLAFLGAAALDPTCAVSYYGSGVAGNLDQADAITCPILFHFGGSDPYLPSEDSRAVADRFADVDNADVLIQADAGHAFDNHLNPMFSNPPAAAAAWEATAAFLAEHLPVG
ncbi:MAG: dienelactone hydrolase family protein [Acidimicrobiia bacterium]|nr:dienelactone hydrolase family protein [Acidimicrobiia bacterium]